MKTDGTLTLQVRVSDFDAAKHFYGEVLGLTRQYEVPEIGWCEYESGVPGLTIGLDRGDVTPGGTVVPTFGVVSIDDERARLESLGVLFNGPTVEIEGMVRLAHFADPDGNHLCLAESLAGG